MKKDPDYFYIEKNLLNIITLGNILYYRDLEMKKALEQRNG